MTTPLVVALPLARKPVGVVFFPFVCKRESAPFGIVGVSRQDLLLLLTPFRGENNLRPPVQAGGLDPVQNGLGAQTFCP